MINKHPSIELCREADQLGIKFGETYWIWWRQFDTEKWIIARRNQFYIKGFRDDDWDRFVALPSAEEVADILPAEIEDSKYAYGLVIEKTIASYYVVSYDAGDWDATMELFIDESLVNALLRMAIHLKKKGLLPINTPNGEKGKEL